MVLLKLAMVLVELMNHDDRFIFGNFYNYGSSLLHPCKALANRSAAVFAVLSYIYQDNQLKEQYGPIAILSDGTVLGALVVQLPYEWNSNVVTPIHVNGTAMW